MTESELMNQIETLIMFGHSPRSTQVLRLEHKLCILRNANGDNRNANVHVEDSEAAEIEFAVEQLFAEFGRDKIMNYINS